MTKRETFEAELALVEEELNRQAHTMNACSSAMGHVGRNSALWVEFARASGVVVHLGFAATAIREKLEAIG